MTESRIAGIVLAAGASSRMGRPKPELELEGRTFLQRCIEVLLAGGCELVVAVVANPATAPAERREGVLWARNARKGSETIDSIRIGLAEVPTDCAAALILPVDAPAVRPETVQRLIAGFRAASRAEMVRPVYAGRPGHPTLFARGLFAELAEPGLAHGAQTIVQRHSTGRVDVPVEDPGVIGNVNTPEDYRRLVERHE